MTRKNRSLEDALCIIPEPASREVCFQRGGNQICLTYEQLSHAYICYVMFPILADNPELIQELQKIHQATRSSGDE